MAYRVGDFIFGTEEEARLAGKEAEGIKYILTRNDMNDPDTVLKLYNRLIEKEVFATPVGFRFLEELRQSLLAVPYIRQEELLPLPVHRETAKQEESSERSGRVSHVEQRANRTGQTEHAQRANRMGETEHAQRANRTGQTEHAQRANRAGQTENPLPLTHETIRARRHRRRSYYRPFLVSTFLAVVFALTLIGVFIITALSENNTTILNYENSLIDKYEVWEKELTRREEALREKEKAADSQEVSPVEPTETTELTEPAE